MCRQSGSPAWAWALIACLLAANVGCALHHCNFDRGEAVGLHTDCDPHSPQVYHRHDCCRIFRDPRTPGPRVVSTLPAEPEMAADSHFAPVPTYPVFGPHSEEPDGFDPQMLPLSPEGAPLGAGRSPVGPRLSASDEIVDDAELDAEELDDRQEPAPLLAAPAQRAGQDGWKPANKRAIEAMAGRNCPTCKPNFKHSATRRR